MSMISLTTTHWIFALYPRRIGFWVGCVFGLVGAMLSIVGCIWSSPAIVLIANLGLGASCGMGMYMRFAAVEVVPPEFGSQAVCWVLCGGCLAAFIGPETAQATAGKFGDEEHLKFVGVYLVAGLFVLVEAILVSFINFPWEEGEEMEQPKRHAGEQGQKAPTDSVDNVTGKVVVEKATSTTTCVSSKSESSNNKVVIIFDEEKSIDNPKLWIGDTMGDVEMNNVETNDDGNDDSFASSVTPLLGKTTKSEGYSGRPKTSGTQSTVRGESPSGATHSASIDVQPSSKLRTTTTMIQSGGSSLLSPLPPTTLKEIVYNNKFLISLAIGIFSWAIMAMPMSIFRVTMKDFGFTSRQSLTVIEFHFLFMYFSGFWSGTLIKQRGPVWAVQITLICFALATAVNLSAQDDNQSTVTWFIGLILLGIGWNFGFSAATVWVTETYVNAPEFKPKVQAANECGMFFLSGSAIFSSGYLYSSGDTSIAGWRILNFAILTLTAMLALLLVFAVRLQEGKTTR